MAYSVFNKHKKLFLSLTFFIMFGISLQIFAAPPTNPYSQGETLDPSCTPGSANCIVSIIPDQTGNNGKYLTTDGTTTSWASLSGSGISSLNGLAGATQTFAVGTSGTDFNISSTSTTHTFNIPDAGASARGLVTTGTQTFAGSKTFSSLPTFSSLTAGSLMFAGTSGIVAQDNSNLFWDDSLNNLGIGTTTPQAMLHLAGTPSPSAYQLVIESVAPVPGTYNEGKNKGNSRILLGVDGSDNPGIQMNRGKNGFTQASGEMYFDWAWADNVTYDFRFAVADASTFQVKALTQKNFVFDNLNVGIGDTSPTSLFTVGSGDKFQIDTNGNIVKINDVTYSWPGSQAGGAGYTLSNDGSGNLSWVSNNATLAIGSSITSATAGSLLFAGTSGVVAQDNSNLFWDDTNNNLGIMTASPKASLHIAGSTVLSSFQLAIERAAIAGTYGGANTGNARFLFGVDALNNPGIEIMRGKTSFAQASSALYWDWSWSDDVDNDFRFSISDATNFNFTGGGSGQNFLFDNVNVGIGDLSPTSLFTVGSGDKFQIDTNGNIVKINDVTYSWPGSQAGGAGYTLSNDGSGNLSWVTPGAASVSIGSSITSGTSGSVLFLDSSNQLAQNNNNFFWDALSSRLGVGTNTPVNALSVGSSSQFGVDSNGNLVAINGVTYSWPNIQANIGDVLANDGTGNLLWTAPFISVGNSVVNGTTGSMLFVDGTGLLGQDNNNFYWDNSNKRLGIGTFSPASALSVGNSNEFQVNSTGNIVSINNVSYSWPSSQAVTSGYVLTNNGSGTLSWDALFSMSMSSTIGNSPTAGAILFANGSSQLDQQANNLFFDQNNSRLGVGNSAPTALLSVGSNSEFTVDTSGVITSAAGITSSGDIVFSSLSSTSGAGDVVCINGSNTLTRDSSGSCSPSSQRFKYDIASVGSSLDMVNQLRPVSFKYNGSQKMRFGFIAEEVDAVNPELVVREADGVTPHGVYYIDMIPLLAKSIQELDLKINPITSLDIENPNSLGALIKQFLANTQNTILDLYAQIIHADRVETKQLCIGETCVDENQLKQLLQQGGGSSGGAPIVNPNPPVDDTVQSNEVITQDSNESDSEPQTETVPEPEVQPEPQPEPDPIPVIENIPQNDTPVVAE